MTRGTALILVALAAALAGCGFGLPGPILPTGPTVIDGHLIGAPRSVPRDAFHRLEVTARDFAARTWPGTRMSGVSLVSEGGSTAGSTPIASDDPPTFLLVLDLVGGDRHAIRVACDPARFPAVGSCIVPVAQQGP